MDEEIRSGILPPMSDLPQDPIARLESEIARLRREGERLKLDLEKARLEAEKRLLPDGTSKVPTPEELV